MAVDEGLRMSESKVERSRKHIGRYEAETSRRQGNTAENAFKRESGIGQNQKKICPKCKLLFAASREFCNICGNRLVDKNG